MTDGQGAGHVLVAYLTSGWAIEHCFHTSMQGLIVWDSMHQRRLFGSAGGPMAMTAGASGIVEARNKVFTQWLDDTTDEWLWMVDTDMGFPPDIVDLLVEAADPVDRPVVGGLCFGMKRLQPDGCGGWETVPFPTIYDWCKAPDGSSEGFGVRWEYPRDTVTECAGTGAACLLVHRGAAEKIRAEYGDTWFEPVRYADGRLVGEDLSFCYRLAKLDIPLHVHTGARTTHAKTIWVGETDYIAHQTLRKALASARPAEPAEPAEPAAVPVGG